jgi:hypothetical protein
VVAAVELVSLVAVVVEEIVMVIVVAVVAAVVDQFGNMEQELGQMLQEIQVPMVNLEEFLPGEILIQITFLDMVGVVKTD